ITISELIDRTLKNRLEGSYNVIFRGDGRLIAHPRLTEAIQQKKGTFDIPADGDPELKRIFQRVTRAAPGQRLVEDATDQGDLAVTRIDGPDWYFVTVYPKRILWELASSTAKFVLAVGWFS